MSIFYSAALAGTYDGTVPFLPADGALNGGKVHVEAAVLDLAANAVLIGDTIRWARLHKGAIPLWVVLLSSVSLGSSTIDLGSDAVAAMFKAAGTFTAVDTPTFAMKASAFGVALTAGGYLQSVVAAANMPNNAGNKLCLAFAYQLPGNG